MSRRRLSVCSSLVTHHSSLSTQHTALSTQHSALSTKELNVFRAVIGQVVAQIVRLARAVLAGVLFASGAFIAEGFGAADHVDVFHFVFGGPFFVVHGSDQSKERAAAVE